MFFPPFFIRSPGEVFYGIPISGEIMLGRLTRPLALIEWLIRCGVLGPSSQFVRTQSGQKFDPFATSMRVLTPSPYGSSVPDRVRPVPFSL